ncbi:TetR family transcriptional regulator [Defluviimonas sp. 20V17]|uniref:Transcriptional regulator, TetR family n=1 Tax=Allgaiera indica TaxID=765699 RepID=A0A1H2TET9_9RHOB|nr:TetR family transcriptional regulator [Defluviimonas sp. 20V17]SDW42473.1 transcriptional regulator, TetR family [Allgaiera indica]
MPQLAEVFRVHGFEGASLSRIRAETGLGKGSLYHFFPGGKDEMAAAVLADVDAWFLREVFSPLDSLPPEEGLALMWRAVDGYFASGRRICLVGAFALDATRDRFAAAVCGYFERWIASLRGALLRAGLANARAAALAEDLVLSIQGALVLSRALREDAPASHKDTVFSRALRRMQDEVGQALKRPPA